MKPPVIIGIIVVVVILVGGGIYVYANPAIAAKLGLRVAPAQTASTTPNGRAFGAARGGFATGSIETLNGNDFIITLSDGTTKDIDITATTTLENYVTASSTPTTITPEQLSVGEQVSVLGSPNPDGSIDASRVMTGTLPARPTGGRGFGPGGNASSTGGHGRFPAPTPN